MSKCHDSFLSSSMPSLYQNQYSREPIRQQKTNTAENKYSANNNYIKNFFLKVDAAYALYVNSTSENQYYEKRVRNSKKLSHFVVSLFFREAIDEVFLKAILSRPQNELVMVTLEQN